MTQEQHLITPPQELVREWAKGCSPYDVPADHIATQAARWGADQELEGCVKWLKEEAMTKMWSTVAALASALHASRRPKPPSLKEQALEVLKRLPTDPEARYCPSELDTIRRALEALPD